MRLQRTCTSQTLALGLVLGALALVSFSIVIVFGLGSSSTPSALALAPPAVAPPASAPASVWGRGDEGVRWGDEAVADRLFDVTVVGAGVAGLSAALYASRAGLSVLVLGSTSSGQLAGTPRLENYLGFPAPSGHGGGIELLTAARAQASGAGASLAPEGVVVLKVGLGGHPFEVETSAAAVGSTRLRGGRNRTTFQSRALVLATGAQPKRLQISGEPQLWGRYIHSCVLCDGPLYAGEAVVVVGGGDAAVDAARYLARLAKAVFLVHRRMEFRSSNEAAIASLRQEPNVQLLMPYTVDSFATEAGSSLQGLKLRGVKLKNSQTPSDKLRIVQCAGVFVMIGSDPQTGLLRDGPIKLDENQYVVTVGSSTATSVPGVFAAGEVVDAIYRQAITAAGDGAKAAIDAERWLQHHGQVKTRTPVEDATGSSSKRVVADRESPVASPPPELRPHGQRHDAATASKLPAAPSCDLSLEDCVLSTVRSVPVVVFSKSYCPFCRKALEALAAEGVTAPLVLDLTGPDGRAVQQRLGQMTGRRTVPNVFVGGASIGGGDETAALHRSGALSGLLRAANAIS